MKKLELNEMEIIHAGWSWDACIVGAGNSVLTLGFSAAFFGGWVGVGAVALAGCVIQGAAV